MKSLSQPAFPWVLALVAACNCAPPGPPDEREVARLRDPYVTMPARGTVPDLDRAVAAIAPIAKQLHYGDVPAAALRLHAKETWAQGFIKFLADGTDPALKLAWYDIHLNLVKAHIPSDLKFKMREQEGHIYELMNTKADPQVIRRTYLAETAWLLFLLGVLTPDAGYQ